MSESDDFTNTVRGLVKDHRGVLTALAHFDSCDRCESEGVDSTCPVLAECFT